MNYIKLSVLLFISFTFSISAFANEFNSNICSLLNHTTTISSDDFLNFPIVNEEEHSMAHALPDYVKQKIPTLLIKDAIKKGYAIHILGSPPPLLLSSCFANSEFEEIYLDIEKKNDKEENFKRPAYFWNDKKKELIVSVMAGKDYLKQYAAMISYYIKIDLGKESQCEVKVTSFPCLEKKIDVWTSLDENFVKPNDVVIIGNVSDYLEEFKEQKKIIHILSEYENSYYKSTRIKFGKKNLNFFRAKYSFWGNMSAYLVNKMLLLGAEEIVYLSKIATLENPADIYQKIYSPTQFAILENHKVEFVGKVPNQIVKNFPELNTGMHISLATVMEQDYYTSAIAHAVSTTLDLEVSKIAKTILKHNQENNKQVVFTPLHWATDYIRTKDEANLETGYDLANGNAKGKERKKEILKRIYSLLTNYFSLESSK